MDGMAVALFVISGVLACTLVASIARAMPAVASLALGVAALLALAGGLGIQGSRDNQRLLAGVRTGDRLGFAEGVPVAGDLDGIQPYVYAVAVSVGRQPSCGTQPGDRVRLTSDTYRKGFMLQVAGRAAEGAGRFLITSVGPALEGAPCVESMLIHDEAMASLLRDVSRVAKARDRRLRSLLDEVRSVHALAGGN